MKTDPEFIETKFMYLYKGQWFFFQGKWYEKTGPSMAQHKDGTKKPMKLHDLVKFEKAPSNNIRKGLFILTHKNKFKNL